MAFRAFLISVFIAVAVAPALATNYTVGDDAGWTLGVNYTSWAQGKDFRVGDTLTFKYQVGSHNVLKVNATDFQQCASSNASSVPLTSGNDVIPLTSPGKKWYICSIADHCSKGMKLVITVSAVEAPAPTPTAGTPNTAEGPAPTPTAGTPNTAEGPAPTPMPGTPGVSKPDGPAPSPALSTSAAVEVTPLKSCAWMLAVMAAYRMITA